MTTLHRPERRARTPRRAPAPDPFAEITVNVHAPGEAPADLHELADFIRKHEGVSEVVHHAPSGALVVRYDERRGTGRFFRGALLDRITASRPVRSPEPQRLQITIAHELPGRVRLRIASAPPPRPSSGSRPSSPRCPASSGPAPRRPPARCSCCSIRT